MSEKVLSLSNSKENLSYSFQNIKKIFLSVQHLVAMFGATVLVPILTGFDPSVALISAGIGTLVFHLVTKGVVPVFLGSSFAFIPVILTVKELYNGDLSYAQGGIVVAGILYIIMSLLVKKFGVEKIKAYFPSQVTGPMIIVIGLNLVPVAFNMASNNYIVAFITLSIALGINFLGKGFLKQLSILIAVVVGYLVSMNMGIVDNTVIREAVWFSAPKFSTPKFDIGAIAIIAPVVLAVFMEHIGDITTNGAVVGKDFMENPGLNRTLLGDGLATMIAGFLGGPANTTYGENTGVLAITKVYDPSILRLTAVLAIILGCINKIGVFLQTIPVPVMGGISLMLFSMISLIGVKTIKNSQINLDIKNIIIMVTILFIGLASNFGLSIGIPITSTVKITGLSLAAIIGVILNKIINR
ncbi:uracil permease [Alkalithermobacter thermoalcaliphilus JW-YL-7 = DSM 7308]|uniref:Uracil permease n=1 Tax=Alkalithermobacter thermoalcaliphilus JW-YL-7 = DSM 7308 TaxID=1121328 RepID=A0A150FPV5_CLOPD|nr:uracil-xanthine permease [[Clostridium] paradoxum JW-YL-7 = DSM 7308]SHK96893.1 uracil permease [[Clostridium] paradoxum JW-YL-7 = DSM 7308]